MSVPLPQGVVTGLGAVDVTESRLAARITLEESPELPHLPELPLRGPWAEPAGRLAALLVDLPMEIEVGRWRTASGAGRDLRRARAMLEEDLDAVEELWAGYEGPAKLQLLGPLSAACLVELRSGAAVVSDPSAVQDLSASLAEGLIAHVGELRRRVPGARWVVQVDEPAAARATSGTVSRPSGWGTFAAMPVPDAVDTVARLVDAVHGLELGAVLHSCDRSPDWQVLVGAGADALSIPLPRTGPEPGAAAEQLDRWWNEGRGLWVFPDRDATATQTLGALHHLGGVLGVDAEGLQRFAVTPPCAWDLRRRDEGSPTVPAPVGAQAYADLRRVWPDR